MDNMKKGSFSGQSENNISCLKHAINNLAVKSTDISSTSSPCKNCSKTMLSYIFLIQDVLDNLARSIYSRDDSNCCLQCLRQEFNVNSTDAEEKKTETIINNDDVLRKELSSEVVQKPDLNELEVKATCEDQTIKPFKKNSSRRNSRRLSREIKVDKEPLHKGNAAAYGNQDWKVDFLYNVSPSTSSFYYQEESSENDNLKRKPITILNQEHSSDKQLNDLTKCNNAYQDERRENKTFTENCISKKETLQASLTDEARISKGKELANEMLNISFIEDYKPDTLSAFEQFISNENFIENYISHTEDVPFSDNNSITKEASFQPEIEGISWVESTVEAQEQDSYTCVKKVLSATDEENWWKENTLEKQTQNDSAGVPGKPFTVEESCSKEAFVTICRNNFEALGCLVVGNSLLLSRTSKALCVLVFDGVDTKLKELLSSVFHVVQDVASLETSKLKIETQCRQKDLGKSFDKLNVWRLVQFKKCVFLNPDTLVLRNCDELFNYNELSAVPDNGWPDCFNSGVFVYVPSLSTFSKMEEMIRKQGNNDGGEQIFLNSFFTSWSCDLSSKLSFIYNLNLLVDTTYTYAAAFHKFGQNVKIVQFSGSSKPWQVRFYSETNQVVDDTNTFSNSIRFLQEWISIFRVSVLRLFPQDVYSGIFALKTISAEETSMLLCIPERCEDMNLRPVNNQKREKITHYGEYMCPKQEFANTGNRFSGNQQSPEQTEHLIDPITDESETNNVLSDDVCLYEESYDNFDLIESAESLLKNSLLNQYLPVSDSSNYEGMRMWEQGKMDYEGADNSENIIRRLRLLIR